MKLATVRGRFRLRFLGVVAGLALLASGGAVFAAPGDLIGNVNLPVTGFGVSVAVDCSGNVFYTLANDTNLYKMDKTGTLLSTTPITNANGGGGLNLDEFAWDQTRQILWATQHDSNPIDIFKLDRATGVATLAFASQTPLFGTFVDGLAFDGSDDSLWLSRDVSTTIEHYKTDGTLINVITPKNASGGNLGSISGVIVGVGDLLYLGQNGRQQIVQVKKSNGDFLGVFTSPGGARDEGLECDPVNFAPKLALWSREFNSPGFMSVIELAPGTCACGGGGTALPVRVAPSMSQWGLATLGLFLAFAGLLRILRQRRLAL
ncbi:MAG: hypothetical protein ACHQ9S_22625 [Candidatus Binatia bacterium]